MKGVPLRLEVGPRDLENNQAVAVRRDNQEKVFLSLDELESTIPALLETVQKALFDKAKANLDSHTWPATTVEEVKEKGQDGFVKTMWCGETACEEKMKELAGVSSRCIPFEQEKLGDVCPCCGRPAKQMVVWGIAY